MPNEDLLIVLCMAVYAQLDKSLPYEPAQM